MQTTSAANQMTINYFLSELQKKVSASNAKLLMQTAMIKSGMSFEPGRELNKHETETLCLELIRCGGPGFQVGRAIYTQFTRQ